MTHFLLQVVLPTSWIAVSLVSAGFTIPLLLLQKSLDRTAEEMASNEKVLVHRRSVQTIASNNLLATQIRLGILVTFVLFGFNSWLPMLLARLLFTVLLFADNAALGYKSFREYRTLQGALRLAAREVAE